MRKILNISLILFLATLYATFAQFNQNSSRSLFSDVKAFQAGDAIMILITEDTQADNSANTSSSRETSLSGNLGYSTGSGNNTIGGSLGTGTGHQGSGKTTRSEKIRAKLSARVVEIVDNGNLKIEGKRTTKVNGETQTIIIQGVIRPVDVRSDNSVYSYSILDLSLTIDGEGSVSEIQEPGLLTKFFRILF
ncbi:MAG TPA: flagellar basal body L-ring protein FlgH [Candidatus Kapabacteria bacterium]|nr:flagellar basal body L-ring protein FlgH [Candidatus Kapabacteria bacterium]